MFAFHLQVRLGHKSSILDWKIKFECIINCQLAGRLVSLPRASTQHLSCIQTNNDRFLMGELRRFGRVLAHKAREKDRQTEQKARQIFQFMLNSSTVLYFNMTNK
jgi:hypothetical protein